MMSEKQAKPEFRYILDHRWCAHHEAHTSVRGLAEDPYMGMIEPEQKSKNSPLWFE